MIVEIGNHAELYRDLIDSEIKSKIRDDEYTVRQFCDDWGVSRKTGTDRLEKLVKDGKLATRKAWTGGRLVNAYSFIAND